MRNHQQEEEEGEEDVDGGEMEEKEAITGGKLEHATREGGLELPIERCN